MKINLSQPYKSLTNLSDIDLPKFVVLTGLNGAGKTQLLQAIGQKKATIDIDGTPATRIRMFSAGLGEISGNTFYGSTLERFCIVLQNKIFQYQYQRKQNPQLASADYYQYERYFSKVEREIIDAIKKNKKSQVAELEYADRFEIMKHIPKGYVVSEVDSPLPPDGYDVFHHDLSQVFKRYHVLQERNDLNCYLKEKKGRHDVEALSHDEFLAKHGEPPWILANEILSAAKIDYHLTTPEKQGADDAFSVKLISRLSENVEIGFGDLSSGEKVLVSLALALYGAHYDRVYPEVLLLDEPDCHLHPSMAGQLLRVIEEVFVVHRGVSVIMTTHSPSTVALAPEWSLYVMSSTGGRISKQSKDCCLRLLTAGVPTLSIDYDNRVQVFVESKHDARNYGDIYEAIKEYLSEAVSLSFISSGAGGSGSAEQVREIVSVLRRNGNGKIYGIIDWDGKNAGDEFIKVVAAGKRHSFENVIFDPLLLGLYLIREGYLRTKDAGLDSKLNYIRLENLGASDCQTLAAFVTSKLAQSVGKTDDRQAEVSYIGGMTISIARWVLEEQGHSLEDIIKNVFEPLKAFRKENELKNDLIRKVATDFPRFIPTDFSELFSSLQMQHLS